MRSRFTRRHALQTLTSLGALTVSRGASLNAAASAMIPVQAGGVPADQNKRWKGSALGNLYPFIKEEQQRTRQRLAFLHRRPKDLEAWKAECRKKVFDALAYRPAPCKPDAKILERVDKGDYIRERLTFHTAPNVTVPAYLLIPKRTKLPAPAVVALHDHSGFYYWGKEHIIETENEHPALTAFRQRPYDGVSYPVTLARHGYVVLSVNYRLGIGYGHGFHHPEHAGPAGGAEYQDVVAGAKYLQALTDVDPAKIGIWGGSYGGYLTAMGLARNSDIFKAGVDLHGVHDWSSFIAQFLEKQPKRYEKGDIDEAMKVAFDSSPIATMAGWNSPVLLIQGDDDRNVNFAQTIDLARRLEDRHAPFEQFVIPNEIHGFLRWHSWISADTATADFFAREPKLTAAAASARKNRPLQ